MNNSIKIVLGLNIVFLIIVGGLFTYTMLLPFSLPISILVYYLTNSNTKKPATLGETIIKDDKKNAIIKQDFKKHIILRILISSFLAPIILLMISPIINFIFESRNGGSFISMDGVLTIFVLLFIYPFLVYTLYRTLPEKIVSHKLSTTQIAIIIILCISLLFLLMIYIFRNS